MLCVISTLCVPISPARAQTAGSRTLSFSPYAQITGLVFADNKLLINLLPSEAMFVPVLRSWNSSMPQGAGIAGNIGVGTTLRAISENPKAPVMNASFNWASVPPAIAWESWTMENSHVHWTFREASLRDSPRFRRRPAGMSDEDVRPNSRMTVSWFVQKTLSQFKDSERRLSFSRRAAAISGTVIGFD